MIVFMAFFGMMALIGSIIGAYLAHLTIIYFRDKKYNAIAYNRGVTDNNNHGVHKTQRPHLQSSQSQARDSYLADNARRNDWQ